MRPIAMKCTQEQFDNIKDKMELKHHSINSFSTYTILINCDSGEYRLSNIDETFKTILEGLDYHETFDANIFLEACDIEVEKVWNGTELQFKDFYGNWIDCTLKDYEFRLKPQPNYQKEIEALQQKAKENGMNVIINFEKI